MSTKFKKNSSNNFDGDTNIDLSEQGFSGNIGIGSNLSGLNLANINLSNADLENVSFSEKEIEGWTITTIDEDLSIDTNWQSGRRMSLDPNDKYLAIGDPYWQCSDGYKCGRIKVYKKVFDGWEEMPSPSGKLNGKYYVYDTIPDDNPSTQNFSSSNSYNNKTGDGIKFGYSVSILSTSDKKVILAFSAPEFYAPFYDSSNSVDPERSVHGRVSVLEWNEENNDWEYRQLFSLDKYLDVRFYKDTSNESLPNLTQGKEDAADRANVTDRTHLDYYDANRTLPQFANRNVFIVTQGTAGYAGTKYYQENDTLTDEQKAQYEADGFDVRDDANEGFSGYFPVLIPPGGKLGEDIKLNNNGNSLLISYKNRFSAENDYIFTLRYTDFLEDYPFRGDEIEHSPVYDRYRDISNCYYIYRSAKSTTRDDVKLYHEGTIQPNVLSRTLSRTHRYDEVVQFRRRKEYTEGNNIIKPYTNLFEIKSTSDNITMGLSMQYRSKPRYYLEQLKAYSYSNYEKCPASDYHDGPVSHANSVLVGVKQGDGRFHETFKEYRTLQRFDKDRVTMSDDTPESFRNSYNKDTFYYYGNVISKNNDTNNIFGKEIRSSIGAINNFGGFTSFQVVDDCRKYAGPTGTNYTSYEEAERARFRGDFTYFDFLTQDINSNPNILTRKYSAIQNPISISISKNTKVLAFSEYDDTTSVNVNKVQLFYYAKYKDEFLSNPVYFARKYDNIQVKSGNEKFMYNISDLENYLENIDTDKYYRDAVGEYHETKWMVFGYFERIVNNSNPDDDFGCCISLSEDGFIIAIGAKSYVNDENKEVGQVVIYECPHKNDLRTKINDDWGNPTHTLNGTIEGGKFGSYLQLNNDGTNLIVYAPGCGKIYNYELNKKIGPILDNANLSNANLKGLKSKSIRSFNNIILPPNYNIINRQIIGPDVDLADSTFEEIDLSNANLIGAKTGPLVSIDSTMPTNYKYVNSYIVGPNVILDNIDLTNANLSNVDLTGSSLLNAKSKTLDGLPDHLPVNYQIIKNQIIGPNLNLTESDLTNANLNNANLIGSNLTNVDFNNTDIANTLIFKGKSKIFDDNYVENIVGPQKDTLKNKINNSILDLDKPKYDSTDVDTIINNILNK